MKKIANYNLQSAIQKKENTNPNFRFSINIANDEGRYIGKLVCIDRGLSMDFSVIEDLTAWRQRYMKFFLTQFTATHDRTQSWLRNVVLTDPTRILFIICLPNGDRVGNFGVCNLSSESCELDNLIRGKKGGDPHLIYYSEIALLSWLFGAINCTTASLHVFSNNRPTIKLHTSVGFSIIESLPLSYRKSDEMTEYYITPKKTDGVNFDYFKMNIEKEYFTSLHPWVISVYQDFFQVYENN